MSLVAVLLLLVVTKGAAMNRDNACADGLKRCLNIYIGDIMQHTKDTEICNDVSVFVRCILDLDCNLPLTIKTQSFDTVETGLAEKGLKCKKLSALRASYLSGGSKSTSQSSSPSNLASRPWEGNSARIMSYRTLSSVVIIVPVLTLLFLCRWSILS